MTDAVNINDLRPVKNHGFVFILTPIDLLCSEGVEIVPNHRIVRAKGKQLEKIKELLQSFHAGPIVRYSPYEHFFRPGPSGKPLDVECHPEILPQDKWRYWIIEFDGINSEIQKLQYACSLIPNDLEFGFYLTFHEPYIGHGVCWDANSLHTFFNASFFGIIEPKKIEQSDLIQIGQIYQKIKQLAPEEQHIRRALSTYDQLRRLPRTSEMVVIGLISIIESLVSHAPKLTDSADSLSHQLRTKLPLLRKRFANDLGFSHQFPNLDEENLWKKIYGYRSKIVHGEDAQLNGNLSSLKNIETVIWFLKETSKRLLQLSLTEPQFISDLKKC